MKVDEEGGYVKACLIRQCREGERREAGEDPMDLTREEEEESNEHS